MNVDFSNLNINSKFSQFTTHPCRVEGKAVDGKEEVVECEHHEAEFYGVYVVVDYDGMKELRLIADCQSRENAEELISVLTSLVTNYEPAAKQGAVSLDDSTVKEKLIFTHTLENGKQVIAVTEENKKDTLLILRNWVGSEDCKTMELVGLQPEKDEDIFTYANQLLGGKYRSYEFQHE